MMMLSIGYPTEDEEHAILLRFERDDPLRDLQPVTDGEELREAQRQVREIHVEESVRGYVVRIARATREHADIKLGVSPRATLALYRGAQALAAVRGRTFVLPDDVKEIAPYVLTHRVMIGASTRLRGREARDVLVDVMEAVPVPVEEVG
jgi:MoxR-like ATPase